MTELQFISQPQHSVKVQDKLCIEKEAPSPLTIHLLVVGNSFQRAFSPSLSIITLQ